MSAEALALVDRHISRQLRLANVAPVVFKHLNGGPKASAVGFYQLDILAERNDVSCLNRLLP